MDDHLFISSWFFSLFREMEGYEYLALALAYAIIAIAATLIIKSERTKDNYQHLTNYVGGELHNQIYSALKENEEKAGHELT